MKPTFTKITIQLSMLLAGALLTLPAVAQLGPSRGENWRDDDEQLPR